jgi:hypothetical protein
LYKQRIKAHQAQNENPVRSYLAIADGSGDQIRDENRMPAMEPKKEHSEYEDAGTRVVRATYDNPETSTHAEEIKVEKVDGEKDREDK